MYIDKIRGRLANETDYTAFACWGPDVMRALLDEIDRLKMLQPYDLKMEYDHMQEEVSRFRAENARLQQWVDDLQSGMYINCVYCGHRYGPENEIPVSMADVLKEHIEQCPDHPMSYLKKENARLTTALEIIAGKKQPADNLMSDKEVARAALKGEKP